MHRPCRAMSLGVNSVGRSVGSFTFSFGQRRGNDPEARKSRIWRGWKPAANHVSPTGGVKSFG